MILVFFQTSGWKLWKGILCIWADRLHFHVLKGGRIVFQHQMFLFM